MSSSEPTKHDPTVAAVVCTRDRPDALLRTLESLWAQTRLPDELIVIDDGALPPEVPEQIAARCHGLGIAWRYERSRRPGLTRARNQAADLASSEVLQYLDDDVTCEPSFLAEVAAIMHDPLVGGVTATVREPSFESRSARWYQVGYCLAGWWKIGPRRMPPRPKPGILGRPEVAVRARWLSGAAMALRRDSVRRHRFDESLTEYALGEDREMGYRLMPYYWLIESRRAVVTHRRETSGRLNARRSGFMTSHNYIAILRKTCALGPGDWLLIGWSLLVLAGLHLIWAVVGSRRQHLDELRGMLDGLLVFWSRASCGSALLSESFRCIESPGPWPGGRRGADVPARSASEGEGGVGPDARSISRVLRPDTTKRRFSPSPSLALRAGTEARHLSCLPSLGRRDNTGSRRVLLVTNRLEPGGAERMLLALGERLRPHGVEPLIGCLKDAGPLVGECRACGIPVFDHLLHFKTDAGVLWRLGRILREQRIDTIVVAHSGGDRMFWSTLAGWLYGVPVVVWSHWFPLPGQRHFELANRLLYRLVSVYVALGEAQRRALIRHEHLPAGRIIVIPNAIDLERFARAVPRDEARRRLSLTGDQIAVAIIANLRREKRHDVFIEAARRLAAENARLRFFIIGDGPHREAVRAAASASGLSAESLHLLGVRDDVPDLLAGLDICCLCSDQECFSVVMLEAAAAGCAFIGPDSGCLPEFLGHRQTGFLIRPADVAGLADAIRELAADASLRNRLAEAARAKVVASYSLEAMAGAFAALFHSVSGADVGVPA